MRGRETLTGRSEEASGLVPGLTQTDCSQIRGWFRFGISGTHTCSLHNNCRSSDDLKWNMKREGVGAMSHPFHLHDNIAMI